MAYKIFIDTNVFLDAYLERTEDWKDAETILQFAAMEHIMMFTSANNLVNTIYSLQKQNLLPGEIIDLMELTLSYTQLVNTSNASFRHALRAGFNDLEDAAQYYTALEVKGIDYFVTSNIKDYKKASVQLPVVTPKQFIQLYNRPGK